MSALARAREHIHPVVFPVSAGLIIAFVVWGALASEQAEATLGATRDWITQTLGWFFIASVAFFIIFLFYVIVGRYAQVRLGPDDSRPDYSYLTWFAMLFSAGMGIGLVFWGVAEPIFHFIDAPREAGGSEEAALDAMVITFHHWGLGAWSVYAVVGLSLAYFGYRHDLPMTIRSALYPLIGERTHGWAGNLLDTVAVIGTMFGIATSLGLGVAQINAGLNSAFDIEISSAMQVALIAIITVAATISVATGIDKGIRRLSEINITVAGLLMVFVAIVGPTILLFGAYVENVGNYIFNFVEMMFWAGSYSADDQGWLSDWTIFYWAWWISWAPFVGSFIARISRGRTIREFVLGVLLVPSLVSFAWFTVMGNSAILFQSEGTADVYGAMEAADFDESLAMFAMLDTLPLALLTTIATVFVVTVFFITSSDSGSFVLGLICSGGSLNPPVAMRIFWSVSEGAVAAVLLVAGGLAAFQAGAIATGLPFTVVLLIVIVGVIKGLRCERDGVTLADVAAGPLFEGQGEAEVRDTPPRPAPAKRPTDPDDDPPPPDR